MFTGIVQGLQPITSAEYIFSKEESSTKEFLKLKLKLTNENNNSGNDNEQSNQIANDIKLGASIAINGTCLTVKHVDDSLYESEQSVVVTFDVMKETLQRTNLSDLHKDGKGECAYIYIYIYMPCTLCIYVFFLLFV